MIMLQMTLQDTCAHLGTFNLRPVMRDLVPEKELTCLN
jgi:hypothetical protein